MCMQIDGIRNPLKKSLNYNQNNGNNIAKITYNINDDNISKITKDDLIMNKNRYIEEAIERCMSSMKGVDISKFANDFKHKVLNQVNMIRSDSSNKINSAYDGNIYWVGIIEKAYNDKKDELIGININAKPHYGYFILCPKHWHQCIETAIYSWYDIKKRNYAYHLNKI